MRISDWSSDVCSSDLPDIFLPFALSLSKDRSSRKTVLRHARRERKKKTTGFEVQPGGGRSKSSGSRCSDRLRSSSLRAGIACASGVVSSSFVGGRVAPTGEIGRASCGERGCKYG